MTIHVVLLAETPPQPWRNGGGSTRERLAWPTAGAWRLRISVAEITRAGPFSDWPGVRRWFAVLSGNGVALQLPDGRRVLTTDSAAFAFDGAAAPGCTLLDGPTTDLNLMTRGGSGSMQRAAAGVDWRSSALLRGLFCSAKAWLLIDGVRAARLPSAALAWQEAVDASAGTESHASAIADTGAASTLPAWRFSSDDPGCRAVWFGFGSDHAQ